MIIQTLNGKWTIVQIGTTLSFSGLVPGTVYSNLIENNIMADPYWRDNEEKAIKWMDYDYEYCYLFKLEKDLCLANHILLCMEGLDTLADIYLNQHFIASTNNMHISWRFPVDHFLKKTEENELKVIFYSPTKYIKEAYQECPCEGSYECTKGFMHIRKAHYMFGWDWAPKLPDMGIWRSVFLKGIVEGEIEEVSIQQVHFKEKVVLKFNIETSNFCYNKQEYSYKIELISPTKEVCQYNNSPTEITINHPMLWFPNGYGEQALYQIKVLLFWKQNQIDCWEKRIGLRTITIHKLADKFGERFAHRINGIDIFAMGANFIPMDAILPRINKDRTKKLLLDCKDSHFNVIRVWGGGYYPDDYFYDLCDELGFLVWQDFMFACAVYPFHQEFEASITKEVVQTIKRLRHHACIGLWCGNNENESFLARNQWVRTLKQKADYIKIFEYIIPKLVEQYNPERFYWCSSPSSGGGFDKPDKEEIGDSHYWDVWHKEKPFTEFRKFKFRYLSEFGFQSFPSIKTIESYTLEEDRNLFSYVMEKHQKNNNANGIILKYLSQIFLYPYSLDHIIYASQLLQAEAIKYGVEHFRRYRGQCMGTVYWQLNDCWPVASWSSIDYYGRWKALQYYAKRFYAPILLSCEEHGFLDQGADINQDIVDFEISMRLCVTNETMINQNVKINWSLRDSYSNILKQDSFVTKVDPLSATWFPKVVFPEADIKEHYICYELWQNEILLSQGMSLFGVPKYYQFKDPCLTIKKEGEFIIISSKAFAKGVAITNEEDDLLLEDNYFDMNQGEKRIKIKRGSTKNIKITSVYNIGRVQ